MTNPNQQCDVLLFVCSKMADETNLSSKLPVADRTREVWGRKLCWWCLSSGFPLCTFLLGFADSFCFVFTSSPFYEASPLCTILCNLFPWPCWYVEVQKWHNAHKSKQEVVSLRQKWPKIYLVYPFYLNCPKDISLTLVLLNKLRCHAHL